MAVKFTSRSKDIFQGTIWELDKQTEKAHQLSFWEIVLPDDYASIWQSLITISDQGNSGKLISSQI